MSPPLYDSPMVGRRSGRQLPVWFVFPGSSLHRAVEAPGPGDMSAFSLSSSVRLEVAETGDLRQNHPMSYSVIQSGAQGDFVVSSQGNFYNKLIIE